MNYEAQKQYEQKLKASAEDFQKNLELLKPVLKHLSLIVEEYDPASIEFGMAFPVAVVHLCQRIEALGIDLVELKNNPFPPLS